MTSFRRHVCCQTGLCTKDGLVFILADSIVKVTKVTEGRTCVMAYSFSFFMNCWNFVSICDFFWLFQV